MHELSIVCGICELLNKKVLEYGASKVVQVSIKAGELAGIEEQTLRGCFEIVSQATPAEGAELVIERVPIKVRCRSCGNEYETGIPFSSCAVCANESIEIIQGNELYIESIAVE